MSFLQKVDLQLFLPAVFLALLGNVTLSSVAPALYPQQFIYLAAAFISFLIFANIDLRVLRQLASPIYILSIVLLLSTVLFGVLTRGSVRWIDLGIVTLQPSEIVKPLLVLVFAAIVATNLRQTKFLLALLAAIPALILILIQPDLGSSLVVTAAFLGVLFLGGIPIRYFLGGVVLVLLASPAIWRFLADYQRDRILSYLAPGADPLSSGYNAIQSMIAIGSGGFFGHGLGQGTQSQLAFLPERHTDFIFAALAEELGLLGAGLLILAFGILLWRVIRILRASEDVFTQALLGGIFATIFVQTAINIGMNLGLLPITGIPLPFVSAGGSSLLAMSIMLGITSSAASSLSLVNPLKLR